MMVSFNERGRSVPVEELNFPPPTVGGYMASVLERRSLSKELVSRRTGIDKDTLDNILSGEFELDRSTRKKIDVMFPGLGKILERLARHRAFYEKYGMVMPRSPIARALIVRQCRIGR
jgi:hypothetical protein